jgi:hypothetical protein
MSCYYFSIVNYNNVQEGYYSWTGCTGDINISTIGTLQTQYVCAQNVTEEYYGAPLDITNAGICPSPTPTPVTPTLTPTPTPTPTPVTPNPTPTPSATPQVIFTYNLWSGGYYQNVCEAANMFANPANVTIYTTKPFGLLVPGDNVFGDSSLTIPPINSNFTISNGSKFIQISGTLILNVGVC